MITLLLAAHPQITAVKRRRPADPQPVGWDILCEKEFDSHPSQICFEWNTAAHTQDNEQDPTKRAFTRKELQTFFDRADDEVSRIRDLGRKG
jgi:hypothetical protein